MIEFSYIINPGSTATIEGRYAFQTTFSMNAWNSKLFTDEQRIEFMKK